MRQFQLETFGEPFRRCEVDEPVPKAGEVLVRMRAASLNYRDLLVAAGAYNRKFKLPLVPVSDGAGEVVALGESVADFVTGDRVTLTYMEDWPDGPLTDPVRARTLGGPVQGVMSDLRIVPANSLLKTPDTLSDLEAACFPCAGVTAWAALVRHCQVKAGEWVLVQGTGGVSLFALQFAKLSGARVVVTSSSDEKLERARAMGADYLVNYREVPEWGRAIRNEIGYVDHVIEVGGAGTLAQSLSVVKTAGTIALIGVLSGAVEPLAVTSVLMRAIRVQGIAVGSRADMEAMFRAVTAHDVKPVIGETFDFEALEDAYSCLKSARHIGKIGITF